MASSQMSESSAARRTPLDLYSPHLILYGGTEALEKANNIKEH
jgi:hypothetical protein